MLDPGTVSERLSALFADTFHVDIPPDHVDLLESGILDSLQLVDLLLQIEKHFGRKVAIETIDLDDLRSLSRIANLIVSGHGFETTTATSVG